MNEPFREWLYFGDLQNEPGNYQLFKEIWFNEKPCVICIRTGKWSVCCTGSSISKMLSSWVSLASRRSCAFFWGMTATGSHGIRNRWRYAQDDKVFCYLAVSRRWQCGPQGGQPMRHERWVDILHPLGPSTSGESPLTIRHELWCFLVHPLGPSTVAATK